MFTHIHLCVYGFLYMFKYKCSSLYVCVYIPVCMCIHLCVSLTLNNIEDINIISCKI